MSLLNTNYQNIAKKRDIQENWLFQLFNQNSFLSFDGVNDYIDLGTTSSAIQSITSDVTISLWVNFPSSSSGSNVYVFQSNTVDDYWTGFFVYKDSNDKISLLVSDGADNSNYQRVRTGAISFDTFFHITITSDLSADNDENNTKIYFNNVEQTLDSVSSGSPTIGYSSSGKAMFAKLLKPDPDVFYSFKIRNFAIWRAVLNADNRTAIYNSGKYLDISNDSGNYNQSSNLKLYIEFNKGDNKATDLSANNVAGEIEGAAYGGFLALSFGSAKVSRTYYHGVVDSSPSIRESIDLRNSISKSGNLNISAINAKYKGFNLSKEVFGGDNFYHNQTVKVYSQLNNTTDINNCLQIYHGRLVSVSHGIENISFSIVQHRPWDYLVTPTDKTTERKLLVPIAYGDYTKNGASTFASPKFRNTLTSYDYRSVEFNKLSDGFAIYPNTNAASSDGELAIYNEQFDMFVPLANAQSTTVNTDGAFHGRVESRAQRIFGVRPDSIETIGTVDSRITVSNLDRVIDSDNTNFAQFSANFTTFVIAGANYYLNIDTPEEDENFFKLQNADGDDILINDSGGINSTDTTLIIDDASGLFVGSILKLKEEIVTVTNISSNTLTIVRGQYNTTAISHSDDDRIFTTNNYNVLHVKYEINVTSSAGDNKFLIIVGNEGGFFSQETQTSVSTVTAKVPFPGFCKQVVLSVNFIGDGSSAINGNFKVYDVFIIASRENKKPPKKLFIANDGLSSSLIDDTTVSGTITKGLYAHRDILARFTGYDVRDSDLYNWSSNLDVNSLRSAWSIRLNNNKEEDVKKILEKIQKEFGFIFKFRPDGTGSYWTVKASYASGDVVETLTKDDIKSINISHTSFNQLITKMTVNYVKHPAENRYLQTIISENSTASPTPRERMNIKDKENTSVVNLDYNIDKPGNADIGGGSADPTDGYSDYYMNIFGDIKKIISCDIVNVSKGYKLEAGDIIQFNIDEIKPFGEDWSNYYMVTTVQRSLNQIKIQCREVG